ncbi:unnamed protein product [Allacma fusca]|uniref:Uncharacterized protein n=1 Tax=Allacma fusca TaxID=39272 RepID=A0A8J2PZ41_9HEXA|nr:unnamed protein product [Allacma fusca]
MAIWDDFEPEEIISLDQGRVELLKDSSQVRLDGIQGYSRLIERDINVGKGNGNEEDDGRVVRSRAAPVQIVLMCKLRIILARRKLTHKTPRMITFCIDSYI